MSALTFYLTLSRVFLFIRSISYLSLSVSVRESYSDICSYLCFLRKLPKAWICYVLLRLVGDPSIGEVLCSFISAEWLPPSNLACFVTDRFKEVNELRYEGSKITLTPSVVIFLPVSPGDKGSTVNSLKVKFLDSSVFVKMFTFVISFSSLFFRSGCFIALFKVDIRRGGGGLTTATQSNLSLTNGLAGLASIGSEGTIRLMSIPVTKGFR